MKNDRWRTRLLAIRPLRKSADIPHRSKEIVINKRDDLTLRKVTVVMTKVKLYERSSQFAIVSQWKLSWVLFSSRLLINTLKFIR